MKTPETPSAEKAASSPKLLAATIFAICLVAVFSFVYFDAPVQARATFIAGVCLVLWLSEIVPPFVPTLVLWGLTVVFLAPVSADFNLETVLRWAANPVLVLFFGGFAFGVAASRYGLDLVLARLAVRFSGGGGFRLLILTATATALMSMWMSNIAAAAMMIAALHPLTARLAPADNFRRALLLAIAVGANFGGIATPIGTGPNAIAVSALARSAPVTFAAWMTFALPLTVGLLAAGVLLIKFLYGVKGAFETEPIPVPPVSRQGKFVLLIFGATVLLWLTESAHGVSSATVALLAAGALFGTGLLTRADLNRIDWGTIALIAGGITLGSMLEQADLINFWAGKIPWSEVPFTFQVFLLCFASALLSGLMSNTATVTMLIPFAASFIPDPKISILIAVSASLGIPFVISTPINAMVHGEGGVGARDFFAVGFPLMLAGSLLLALTGFYALSLLF